MFPTQFLVKKPRFRLAILLINRGVARLEVGGGLVKADNIQYYTILYYTIPLALKSMILLKRRGRPLYCRALENEYSLKRSVLFAFLCAYLVLAAFCISVLFQFLRKPLLRKM